MKRVALIIDDEVQIRRLLRVVLEAKTTKCTKPNRANMVYRKSRRPVQHHSARSGFARYGRTRCLETSARMERSTGASLSVRDDEQGQSRGTRCRRGRLCDQPFSTPELLARLRAAQRKTRPEEEVSIFKSGDLVVDLAARLVMRDGQEIKLTATEYALFDYSLSTQAAS